LCDKCEILLSIDKQEDWGFDSKTKARNFFKEINKLRDNLSHSQEKCLLDIPMITEMCDTAEGVIQSNINTIMIDLYEAVIEDNRNN